MVSKLILVIAMVMGTPVLAQTPDIFTIAIKEHRFEPDRLVIPAGKKVKLVIDNQDPTPEEFESHSLNREKVISGGKQGIVYVGPLKKGSYDFVGEFNQATAKGVIVAE